MAEIRVSGIEKLEKKLKKNMSLDDIKKVVQSHGVQMKACMKENAKTAFIKGYSKGDTADSIIAEFKDGGMTAKVGPTTAYSEHMEFGTRFMEPVPFIVPTVNEQKEKLKQDMQKLVR